MRDSKEQIDRFAQELIAHAEKKSELYDGVNRVMKVDTAIILAAEELGEIAAARTRERWLLARQECIDLAHCAMLIVLAIDRENA